MTATVSPSSALPSAAASRAGEAGTTGRPSVRGPARAWRGSPDAPRWERPALLGLLGSTAVLYLWGLSASGWANAFYSAAVQAGSQSWTAFFFGSFDAGNAITVDKPPASLWVMELSARVFGVNAWSILAPQALEGVAAVGLLYATVRRRFGAPAALLAGAALAVTPVAVLMFRFNNPDALLTLLLVGAAYALVRALESADERAGTRWILLVGVLVGFAFLTKMLQAFLVVPGFALVYLVAAPTSLRRRLGQLLGAGAALLASAGWWVAVVELWPADSRPYIGGSQNNSVLELVLGYNGLGRLTGNEVGAVVVGGGAGRGGAWGETGLTRLFNAEVGGQVAWLLPAALVLLAVLLWLSRGAPRSDGQRAQVLIWGSWLLVTGLTFSLMQGIFHAYYTVALAPAVSALVGIGATSLWQRRDEAVRRAMLAGVTVITAAWSFVLLSRSADFLPWLRWVVLAGGIAAGSAVLAVRTDGGDRSTTRRSGLAAGIASVALVSGLAGPAAYAADTAGTPKTGAIPTAGPAVDAGRAGPGRPWGAGGPGAWPGGPPAGAPGARDGRDGGDGGWGRGPGQGGLGGLLETSTPSAALTALVSAGGDDYTWVAAAVGSNSAAGVQLATGYPVMPIGGFNGSDPSPTLQEFQALVAAGEIHYFLGEGSGGRAGFGAMDSRSASEITTWVEDTFPASTVDGVTVYDLTGATS